VSVLWTIKTTIYLVVDERTEAGLKIHLIN